jgi:excisionase family DNA binding protein
MELGGGGAGGMATEMAVGLAIAQQMIQKQGPGLTGAAPPPAMDRPSLPEMLTVAQVAEALGVGEDDVRAVIEAGELPAKKIGSVHRVKRSALEAYLAD